jgi:dolichol-phosphate mannosyltransferase
MDANTGQNTATSDATASEPTPVKLSLLAPALDEVDNVDGLVSDVAGAIEPTGWAFELIVVDDGSTDGTVGRLTELCQTTPWLRVCRMAESELGPGLGPSAVIGAGLRQARGTLVATLDADRQNDPNEIPRMVEAMEREGADFVQGDRSANRRDNFIRRRSSEVGRAFRRTLLGDNIRDSACALRVMRRDVALQIPFQFKGIHRFMAFYAGMIGGKVIEVPVNHRPRVAGQAKFGIWNRALPGLIDLFAVRWMRSRYRPARCEPVAGGERSP